MTVIETQRLVLRHLELSDAPFIFRLVNEPAWIEYIGDKGVRSVADAEQYIARGPIDMYNRHGFGLYLVESKDEHVPAGICGLIKREALPDADVGFALLPEFQGRGYAFESASAVVEYARRSLGLARLVAITTPHNDRSGKLLEKLGFAFERMVHLNPDGEELKLYASSATARSS